MADLESSCQPSAEADGCVANGRSKRRARPWHRVLGLLAALPLMWVLATGALLNHTVDWKLDQRMVHHPWIMAAYGMNPEGEPVEIAVGGHLIAEWDGQIFYDKSLLAQGRLVGAFPDGEGIAVVADQAVYRVDASGRSLEVIGGESLPSLPLVGAATHNGSTWVETAEGWYRVDEEWLDFTKADGVVIDRLSMRSVADDARMDELRRAWSGGGLPVSKILLDLHAGHFLGSFARYFYDLVTLAALILCITGLILFFRKPRRAR